MIAEFFKHGCRSFVLNQDRKQRAKDYISGSVGRYRLNILHASIRGHSCNRRGIHRDIRAAPPSNAGSMMWRWRIHLSPLVRNTEFPNNGRSLAPTRSDFRKSSGVLSEPVSPAPDHSPNSCERIACEIRPSTHDTTLPAAPTECPGETILDNAKGRPFQDVMGGAGSYFILVNLDAGTSMRDLDGARHPKRSANVCGPAVMLK
jgi:hypothetical protein